MIALRFALVLTLGTVLSGCINSGTYVRVKPDGSGTIEQTTMVNLAAVKGMMAGMGLGGGKMNETPGAMDEADFKRAAERMGVRPVSLTPVKEGGFEGSKALFAFDDITKVRIDQDPPTGSDKPASSSPIRFGFAKQGGSSVLTITVDEKQADAAVAKAGASAPGGLDQIDPALMKMVKQMFQGLKVAIDLELVGQIVKTNAEYVNGSRITLLEVDAAGLFENEAQLKTLQSKFRPGVSISELRPLLKDIKGVKVNNPSLTVEFR